MSTFSEGRQWLGTVWEEIPFFQSLPSFIFAHGFCPRLWLIWERHVVLCVSEGSAKHGRCRELDALLSGTGNLETAPPASTSEWPGHIIHAWASPGVMQSWCNLKSGRLTSFAFLSVREKPGKCSPQKSTHRSDHFAYCNAREMRNKRHWRLLLFFLSPLPANTVPIFYKATTQ